MDPNDLTDEHRLRICYNLLAPRRGNLTAVDIMSDDPTWRDRIELIEDRAAPTLPSVGVATQLMGQLGHGPEYRRKLAAKAVERFTGDEIERLATGQWWILRSVDDDVEASEADA